MTVYNIDVRRVSALPGTLAADTIYVVKADGESVATLVFTNNSGTIDAIPVGLLHTGDYSVATAYSIGQIARNQNSTWIAVAATTGNAPPTLPTTSNAYWELLARGSEDGTVAGVRYTFSSSTSMANPGAGYLRFNDVSASTTIIAINEGTAASGYPDISAWINNSWANGGQIIVTEIGAEQNFAVFEIDSVTDNTGWFSIAVTHSTSNGTITNDAAVGVSYLQKYDPVGDLGSYVDDAQQAAQDAAASELAADAAKVAAETARDLAETYAGVEHRAATWTDLAAISGTAGDIGYVGPEDTGTHTDPVVGGTVANEGVYEWDGTGLGSAEAERVGSTGLVDVANDIATHLDLMGKDNYSFPRERSKFGLVYMPSNFSNASSEITLTGWNTAQITAGSGNDYRAVFSNSHSFVEDGSTIVFWIRVESGSHSAPILYLNSSARGSETLTFVEELPGLYVMETITPTGGFSSVTAILTSSDASNPVVCSKFMYSVAIEGATSIRNEYETDAIQAWASSGYFEGPNNLWSLDKATLSVTDGDGSETVRATGITVDTDEEYLFLCYIEDGDGNPANVDRAYIKASSFIYTNPTEIVYLDPIADYPGVYAKRAIFDSLTYASLYLELIIDNAQTITSYTQSDVQVQAIQCYKDPPSTFYPPELTTFRDATEIRAHVYDGQMNVFTPTFMSAGRNYICWQIRRFDETGHPYGGGVGSVLEEVFYCQRTGLNAFKPLYDGTDVGLNGFAIKKDDTVDDFVGADVHGGQARRSSPQLLIDDVAVTHGARSDYVCSKVELREFYELYSPTDGSTVFAHVDTVQIWEGNTFKHKTTVTYQSNEDIITDYLYMLSPKLTWDDTVANGTIWEIITMPDQSDAVYTPGGSVSETYPSESHFQMADTTNGLSWDVEVQGAVPATFRSWIQSSASSRKLYMAVKAITDSSGIVAERGTPIAVTNGEIVELEVWTTVTDT